MQDRYSKKLREISWRRSISKSEIEEYQRDPDSASALTDLKAEIIALPWVVVASSSDLAMFVRQCLNRIWNQLVLDALEALEWGHSPMEVTWELSSITVFGRRYPAAIVPSRISPVLPKSVRYLLDESSKQVVGFRVVEREGMTEHKIDILDEKAMWYTHLECKAGNPYGISIFERSATEHEMYKDLLTVLAAYVENISVPPIIGYAPNRVVKVDGREMEATQYLLERLQELRGQGVTVIPTELHESGQRLWNIEQMRYTEGSHEIVNLLDQLMNRKRIAAYGKPMSAVTAAPAPGMSQASLPARFIFQELLLACNKRLVRWIVELNWGPEEWAFIMPANQGIDIDLVRDIIRTMLQFSAEDRQKISQFIDWITLFQALGIPPNIVAERKEVKPAGVQVPGVVPSAMPSGGTIVMPQGSVPPQEIVSESTSQEEISEETPATGQSEQSESEVSI